jgi:hypothetical protein
MMNEERDCFSSLCRACYTCEACITCQHYLDAFVYVWTFKWLKITFRERKKK